MRRYSLTARRLILVIASTLIASLAVAASGQAVVVTNGTNTDGVALVPGSSLLGTGYSPVTNGPSCYDPGLTADLGGPNLPAGALCLQDGNATQAVLHNSETFAFTWDPNRGYWETTRGYVEQFLRDVADSVDGNELVTSPFGDVGQYTDRVGDRATPPALYGGGCIDYGATGGYTCQLGNTNGSGTGRNYPAEDPNATPNEKCTPSILGDECVTDAAIQHEVSYMLSSTDVLPSLEAQHITPLVVMLMPPNVEVCLDSSGHVCSANSNASARFCSYHSAVGSVPYVVQPWSIYTDCDEANFPQLPTHPTPAQIETDAGSRLVSPLSAAMSAAVTNPFINGWFANDGAEINDNLGCGPGSVTVDTVSVGNGSYALERESNNAATLTSDVWTYGGCVPAVMLGPTFVVPSAVDAGDTVEFDGSATASTLIVPNAGYQWDFGDGTKAVGPSVEHSYAAGGTYNVKLTVTDRGGNTSTIVQTIQVLGANGQPVTGGGGSAPPATPTTTPTSGPALSVHLQLLPQSLKAVLAHGIGVRVSSNKAADGIATVWITRKAARRAGIGNGRAATVRIGIGTVASITNGTITLHLHLSRSVAKKLARVGHVSMTIRLALVAAGNEQSATDAAASY